MNKVTPPTWFFLSPSGSLADYEFDPVPPVRVWLGKLTKTQRRELYSLRKYAQEKNPLMISRHDPKPEGLVTMDWIEEHGGERHWFFLLEV